MTSSAVPSIPSGRAGDSLGSFLGLALLGLGLESAFWIQPLRLGTGWTLAVAAHGVCVAGALGAFFRVANRGGDTRSFRLLALAVGLWGPLGALGCLLHGGLLSLFLRRPMAFVDWYASLFPDATEGLAERTHAAIVGGRDENPVSYRVDPFLDVLRLGGEREKFEALGRIAGRYDPRFRACLRHALVDPSNNVRVMAATVLVRLQDEGRARLRARMALAEAPEAPFEVLLDAACACDEDAFSGLSDDDSAADSRRKALRLLDACATQRPDDAEVAFLRGRLLLRLGRVEEAAASFLHCRALGDCSVRTRGWLMECFFRQGDFARARALAIETMPPGENAATPCSGPQAFWSAGARAA